MTLLRTSDVARAAGVHPNTVRRYAERGLLPPVGRGPNGYRLFTRRHVDCMRVAGAVYTANYASMALRMSAGEVVARAVADDWGGALERARAHLALVLSERAHAEAAATLLERWATGATADTDATEPAMPIGRAARVLGVTIDMMRNWDRNGLIAVPRDPSNGYRRYGAAEIERLRVIRLLSRAGYSLSAILRMLIQLDRGDKGDLRRALDTPRPDEDVYGAADRWLSALAEQERRARATLALIEEIVQHQPVGTR